MKSNKKMKKTGLLLVGLAAVASLAACDVDAELTKEQYDQPLVGLQGVANNTLGKIYDSLITAGDSNSEEVLNQILLHIANDQFGTFYDQLDADGNVEYPGIRTIIEDDDVSVTVEQFLSTHKAAYYGDSALTDVNAGLQAEGKLKIFYNYLLEQINRSFMSNVGNADYTEDNKFYEEDFYDHIKSELYEVKGVADADFRGNETDEATGKTVRVGVQVEQSYPFDASTKYGTDQVTKYFQDDYLDVYKDYIEKSILPNLMRGNLVQQYLYDRNYSTFGRSAARDIQFISLADNSDYTGATENLVRAYAKLVLCENFTAYSSLNISFASTDLTTIAKAYWENSKDLNFLNDLYLGYFDWDSDLGKVAEKIYTAAGFTEISTTYEIVEGEPITLKSYEETTLGGHIVDFKKITDSRFTNDKTIYDDFTGTGTHSPAVGMQLKIDNLQTTDNTTEGWYTESSLTGLPSAYSSRLFKITTANDVDSQAEHSETEQMNYGYYVEGDYYLGRETYVTSDASALENDPTPILIYDSSTWYICRVDEAIKASKVRIGGELDCEGGDTPTIDGVNHRNEVVRQISDMLSDNSSYTSSANELYVKNAAISYHDDAVYDYFEATFPDLFD